MEEFNTEEWIWVNKHLTILGNARSIKHQDSINELLDNLYPTEVPMSTNKDLSFMDRYSAFVVVLVSMHQLALIDEYFEIIPKIEKAYDLQKTIVSVYVRHMMEGSEREEYLQMLQNEDDLYNTNKVIKRQ